MVFAGLWREVSERKKFRSLSRYDFSILKTDREALRL